MKISDLRPLVKVDEIEVEVFEKAEPRTVNPRFGNQELRVCDAKVKDETGEIQLTLWNDEIDLVPLNSKIKITNGYVKEWNGALQLSAGKYGKIDVLE
jgi:replication factor A1